MMKDNCSMKTTTKLWRLPETVKALHLQNSTHCVGQSNTIYTTISTSASGT